MRLSRIVVHPVKSLRGVSVPSAEVRPAGLRHDRRWMLVDDAGRFVTQRTEGRMAQAEVALTPSGYRIDADGRSLDLPETHEGARTAVTVWASTVDAVVYEPGGEFFSQWLGRPLRLVYLPDDVVRPAGSHAPDDRVSLADAYPYLLIGEASLADLNARIDGAPLPMERFRPNFVVEGSEPYAEDQWSALNIGELAFRGVKRCDRCVLTTRDPWTGQAGPEPLRTLATYRQQQGKVWFGMNLVAEAEGTVEVGAPVRPHP